MENLNAEQAINELETQIKYAKFIRSEGVLLSAKCATFVLEHARYYEQRIGELTETIAEKVITLVEFDKQIARLTEENERLKSVEFTCGFIKPHKVLECPIFDEVARTKADTVRKMQERLKEHLDDFYNSGEDALLDVPDLIDQIAKEMLEGINEKG